MRAMDHAALLQKAAHKLGGEEALRRSLGVTWLELQDWLHANSAVPTSIFLKLVDVLSGDAAPLASERTGPAHPFLDEHAPAGEKSAILERALDAAIEAADADFGNLQLLDPDGLLRIRAQRGFEAPFLEFFGVVSGEAESACGIALLTRKQFSVPDVARSDVLRGPAGDAILAAGVRSVQSTPIFDPAGKFLGVLSVHHRAPGVADERVLALVAAIARRAGAFL